MRVDASQVLAQGGIKTKQGENQADSVKDKSGLNVNPEVEQGSDDDLSPVKPGLMRGFSDMSLAPYAAKLAQLNIPVTEKTAAGMRDLMAQNPKLSMEEAAFLASNEITGDESQMKAALGVMSGGEKTSAMIAKIISTLNTEIKQDFLVNQDLGTRDPENSNSSSAAQNNNVQDANFQVNSYGKAPLSELMAAIVKSAPQLLASAGGAESEITQTGGASDKPAEQIISQHDSNMQINTEKNAENLRINIENVKDNVVNQQDNTAKEASTGKEVSTQTTAVAGKTEEITAPVNAKAGAVQDLSPQRGETKTLQATVAQLLSELPEFKGTPQSALDKFSNMLLRIARDTGVGQDGNIGAKDIEALTAQLEKMFTKIDRKDPNVGLRLKEAREEMFARLTLVQEEISRAAQPMKEQLLSQTQKLMDHVKLLNNIEQFTYMQLPIQTGQDQKSAELYVFKRKGGKRADPDNINILLAVDLEFMGHWEALLNIKGKDVYLNMEVAGEAEKEHFNSNTVLLHELLAEEGFKLVNTNIKISQEETTPLTALSALDRYSGAKLGKIDFKI